jgi:hypothetical protein
MNRRPDNNDLLADVLSETAPPDFRAALLGETLCLVRRRRRWRQTRRAVEIFTFVGLLTILIWQNLPEPSAVSKPLAKKMAPPSYDIIHTQRLPDNAIVTTRSFSNSQRIASVPSVVQIATTGGEFRQINDGELLALVSGKPAVLIRTGPHSEELVFANPEDQKGFLKN